MTELGLSHRLTLTGTITGDLKLALLQTSRLFVLPSREESFGMAVVEAMAAGLPVIVSPGVAIQDAIADAGAGLVVRRDVSEIGRAMRTYLEDPALAAATGKRGQGLVLQRFDWDRIAALQESVYIEAIQIQRSRSRR
jgi:glycosyltransferase involved in cell wall biosynthesis